jgi:MoxR-like ATPase
LLERPLLRAIGSQAEVPPVLLIDELDRSDAEFEAYLLEVLSDYQISIPEIGTIQASQPPYVIITSNRTREVHDALKRRCLYHWIEYPDIDKEMAIIKARLPQADPQLAQQVAQFTQALRQERLFKVPGVAETLDWMQALAALGTRQLDRTVVEDTLGVLLKTQEDLAAVQGERLEQLLPGADA